MEKYDKTLGCSLHPLATDYVLLPGDRIRVEKGWGYEDWIYNGPDYCGKILFFNKGKRCSWHWHRVKDEVLYLHSGLITVKYAEHRNLDNAREITLRPGMAFHVETNLTHQMIAEEDSLIYEFSTHHEDSDSVRVVKGD